MGKKTSQGARECKTATPTAAARRSSSRRSTTSTARRRGRPVLALEDVCLEVRPREFLALLGPSGCGKSTLLYLIGGFLPIERGRSASTARRSRAPAPTAASCSSISRCFPWKTVRANVLYGLEKAGLPRGERESARRSFIDLVGLTGFEDSYPVAALRRHEAAHRASPARSPSTRTSC